MIVKVTRRHINKGLVGDSEACPIALAVKAVVKRGVKVFVLGDVGIEFTTKDKSYVRKLPKKALAFIGAFDACEAVEPIELNINIPEQLLR